MDGFSQFILCPVWQKCFDTDSTGDIQFFTSFCCSLMLCEWFLPLNLSQIAHTLSKTTLNFNKVGVSYLGLDSILLKSVSTQKIVCMPEGIRSF